MEFSTAPQNLYSNPGNRKATLTWQAPSNDGGDSITGYNIYRDGTLVATVEENTYTVTGLTNGLVYALCVAAENSAGISPYTCVNVIPRTIPSAPTNLAAIAGDGQIALGWGAPCGQWWKHYNYLHNL